MYETAFGTSGHDQPLFHELDTPLSMFQRAPQHVVKALTDAAQARFDSGEEIYIKPVPETDGETPRRQSRSMSAAITIWPACPVTARPGRWPPTASSLSAEQRYTKLFDPINRCIFRMARKRFKPRRHPLRGRGAPERSSRARVISI